MRQAQGHQFSAECLGRGRELQGFFRRWDDEAIRRDGPGYRRAGLELIARTRVCIQDELAQIEGLESDRAVA